MVDWNRQQVSLTPEDLDQIQDKTFSIVREVEERDIESAGRKFKVYTLTVQAVDKRRFAFDVFGNDLEPLTKCIQTHKLADEMGVRLTLGVKEYEKKDKTATRKIVLLKAEAPAQQTNL